MVLACKNANKIFHQWGGDLSHHRQLKKDHKCRTLEEDKAETNGTGNGSSSICIAHRATQQQLNQQNKWPEGHHELQLVDTHEQQEPLTDGDHIDKVDHCEDPMCVFLAQLETKGFGKIQR